MKKNSKVNLIVSAQVAAMVAEGWTDEYLMGKKAEDLMRAYGCTEQAANQVLKNELTRRNIRR
jgi:hypothetical protein